MENNKKYYPELKNLLLSILGTAIGVGLTVFVNNIVESRHQQAAQRETAIMAVCDIDEIVQGLKEEMYLEDSLFKVTMYVSTHQELIDSLSMDTLDMAFKYLYDNPMVVKDWTADTKETAFNSGIDARMNLGNNQFYDNVQSCYYVRRSLIKVMEDAPMFRRPVSKEAYEDFMYQLNPTDINYDGVPFPNAQRSVMKQVFAHETTTLYIKRYFSRRDTYKNAVDELDRLNRENKLLMDITDEEIEAYIKRHSDNVTAQISADLIIGTWEMNFNNSQNTYVFHEDNTFERSSHFEGNAQIQLEEEQMEVFVLTPITIYIKGRWELRGDTLFTDLDASTGEITSFDLDLSNFPQSALERGKDSLEAKKDMMKQCFLEEIKHQNLKWDYLISFDKNGNTMMWTYKEKTPTGNTQSELIHLYRKQE